MQSSRTSRNSADKKHLDLSTHRYYETIKAKEFDFSTRHSSLPRQSKTQQIASLVSKISELELMIKTLESKLESMTKSNTTLKKELQKTQTLNRELLANKVDINEMQFLAQEFFISDAKKQVSQAKTETTHYRQEVERQKFKAEAAHKDKRNLESVIKRYRRIITADVNLKRPREETYLPQLKTRPPPNETKILEVLEQHLKELASEPGLSDLLTIIANTCKSVLNCAECTIFLLNPGLLEEYSKEFKSIHDIHRTLVGTSWIHYHTGANSDLGEPLFSKLESTHKGIINKDSMVLPLNLHNEVMLVIQVSGLHVESKDELMMRIIVSCACSSLSLYMALVAQKTLAARIDKIGGLAAAISEAKTHQEFSNTIFKVLPEFINFESAGILYADDKDFFANALSPGINEKFSPEIIRFPLTLGVSSEVLRSRTVSVYLNIKQKPAYNPDVDNLSAVKDIKSLLMAYLPGSDGKPVGVLQLVNKKGGPVTQFDLKIIEQISPLIGSYVSGINYNVEAVDLTIRLREAIGGLFSCLEGTDQYYSGNLNDVKETLKFIKFKLYDWGEKKTLSFE